LVNVEVSDIEIDIRVQPVFVDYPEHDVTMLRHHAALRAGPWLNPAASS
jgi:hypothetical protein